MKTNRMKKNLLFLIIFSICTFSSIAQNKNRDRIKMLKISYISNAIDLTPNEAEKFWPIYNEFEKNTGQLKNQLERGNFNSIKNASSIDALSDEKAEELVSNMLTTESEIAKAKNQLVKELSSIISFKKILKLQKAERDFNKRMLQEFGKRRRMNGQ